MSLDSPARGFVALRLKRWEDFALARIPFAVSADPSLGIGVLIVHATRDDAERENPGAPWN